MYTQHRTSSPSYSASPPAPPYYVSNQNMATPSPTRSSRADNIVQNLYTKVAQILTQSRLLQYDSHANSRGLPNTTLSPTRQPSSQTKRTNKWFNLEMDDSDIFKEDIKYWRQAATTSTVSPDPMVIEFFLDISELAQNQILVLTDQKLRRHKVDLPDSSITTQNIMLESWQLTLNHPLPDPPPDLPIVYKKSITFFRSLFAYVRLLPTYRLFKRLRRTKLSNAMKIGHRIVSQTSSINADIDLDVPIIDDETVSTISEYTFSSIDTPFGVLTLKVIYRTNCDFHIDDDSEAVLSYQLEPNWDEEFFTPTMARYYEEEGKRRQEREGSGGRRRSYPTNLYQQQLRQQTTSPSMLSTSASPYAASHLLSLTPPTQARFEPELPNSGAIFPRSASSSSSSLSSNHRRQPSLGSNYSNYSAPSLTLRNPEAGRNFHALSTIPSASTSRTGRDNLLPSSSPISGSRPNVTLVSPFKSGSLSPSPSFHGDFPSPTYSDRTSSSPIHRSPSSVSLQQQRYVYPSSPASAKSLSTGSGNNMLSSSVRSTTSSSESPNALTTKFSSSFDYRREKQGSSITGRRLSKGNQSDDTTSDRGSYNSSILADDDVGEFVRMINTREPLKLYSNSPKFEGLSDIPSNKMISSAYRSKLARFQQLREAHNNLTDSMSSSSAMIASPQNLEPPVVTGANLRGSLTSSSSSSSSISRSLLNQQGTPSRLHENAAREKLMKAERTTLPQPVQIPQRGSHERYRTRSSSLTSIESGSKIPAMMNQSENNTTGAYSSYPEDIGIGELRRQNSSSSLTSTHRQYHYHPHQQRLARGDSSPGSGESMMKREGSGDETGGPQSSTGSLNVGAPNAIGSLGAVKQYNNRRGSGGSGGLLRFQKKSTLTDDDDLLFTMSEISPDEKTSISSGGVVSGSSPIPSTGSGVNGTMSVEHRIGISGISATNIGISGVGLVGTEAKILVREQNKNAAKSEDNLKI